jgi:Ring finger domain
MTRKSNRGRARVRRIWNLAEVIEMEEQHRQQQQHQQQQQRQQRQQPKQEQHALQVGARMTPSLLEQLDTIYADVCRWEQLLEERHELNIDQLSGLHIMSSNTSSNCLRMFENTQQYFDQRLPWDNQVAEEFTNYRKQCVDLWNATKQTTSDIENTEKMQACEMYLRIWDMLEQLQFLHDEISLWSLHYVVRLCLGNFEAVLTNVDMMQQMKDSDLVKMKNLQREFIQTFEKLQQQQEKANEIFLLAADLRPSLLKTHKKCFQSSTGRILMNNETIESRNDNNILLALFGGNDRSTIEGQVCSICLIDFQQDDRVLRNATKLATKTCTHIFHEECITKWIQHSTHSSSCPCCRRAFLING